MYGLFTIVKNFFLALSLFISPIKEIYLAPWTRHLKHGFALDQAVSHIHTPTFTSFVLPALSPHPYFNL